MGLYKVTQLLLLSVVMATLATFIAHQASQHWDCGSKPAALGLGLLGLFLLLLALLLLDCARHLPADSHTIKTLMFQYIFVIATLTYGRYFSNSLMKILHQCKSEQNKVLHMILKENAITHYGKHYDFASIQSRETYVKSVPITTYEHYEKHIYQMANEGTENIFTTHKTTFYALTSGTTGKNKMYPLSPAHITRMLPHFLAVFYGISHLVKLHRHFCFRLYSKQRWTPTGVPMGSVSLMMKAPHPYNVTPSCFLNINQEKTAMYSQALFALAERELGSLDCISSNLLLCFFKAVVRYSSELCDDIQRGEINTNMGIPENTRLQLKESLRADPERACFLRREFSRGPDGLARRIWPRLSYAIFISTGAFALCANMLKKSFLKGVQIVGAGHGATESGIVGYADPEGPPDSPVNVCASNFDFLEFIPLNEVDQESPGTYFMDQLECGESYEVVVTNCFGLYRFRLGDVIKVVGHRGNTPIYEFQYRLGQRLAITFERTPENMLQDALFQCEDSWPGVTVVDYTSCESFVVEHITEESFHESNYFIFMEVTKEGQPHLLTNIEEAQLDQTLRVLHEPYDIYRQSGAIAQLKIIHVHPGSLDGLKHLMWGEYQNMQFKMPRVQRREHLIRFLLEQQFPKPIYLIPENPKQKSSHKTQVEDELQDLSEFKEL